jgi:hypothetical protein
MVCAILKLYLVEGQKMVVAVLFQLLLFSKLPPVLESNDEKIDMYSEVRIVIPEIFQIDRSELLLFITSKVLLNEEMYLVSVQYLLSSSSNLLYF